MRFICFGTIGEEVYVSQFDVAGIFCNNVKKGYENTHILLYFILFCIISLTLPFMQTTYINMHMHKHTNFTPDFNVTICNQQCSLAKLLAHSNPKSISPENVFFSYCRCHDSNSCCQKTCFKHLFFFFIMKMECNQLG